MIKHYNILAEMVAGLLSTNIAERQWAWSVSLMYPNKKFLTSALNPEVSLEKNIRHGHLVTFNKTANTNSIRQKHGRQPPMGLYQFPL